MYFTQYFHTSYQKLKRESAGKNIHGKKPMMASHSYEYHENFQITEWTKWQREPSLDQL